VVDGLLGALVVLLLVAAAVAVAVVVLRSRARAQAQREREEAINRHRSVDPLAPETALSDPSRLAPGDVVHHEGEQWVVRGTMSLEEDGDRWQEHLLDTGAVRRYLSVEPGEGELSILMWRGVLAPDLTPGPARIEHDGRTWTRAEHGRARFTAIGTTGTSPNGQLEYYDYALGDDRDAAERLSFERTSGTEWEVSVGQRVRPHELDVFHRS
jgi:hypothetical protein